MSTTITLTLLSTLPPPFSLSLLTLLHNALTSILNHIATVGDGALANGVFNYMGDHGLELNVRNANNHQTTYGVLGAACAALVQGDAGGGRGQLGMTSSIRSGRVAGRGRWWRDIANRARGVERSNELGGWDGGESKDRLIGGRIYLRVPMAPLCLFKMRIFGSIRAPTHHPRVTYLLANPSSHLHTLVISSLTSSHYIFATDLPRKVLSLSTRSSSPGLKT
ncbi:MAG: hypothetical protein FRX48_07299 [Lasallia pustulata]|uniref:Uncharacterized protein n=1 Tax=Lasallia pustulata TaxID=136370 RepID=A0A5M8PI12_9LECA|nr:MAG: hypothetical protein FRX48_07299 [Lasallia pustulata]